MNSVSLWLNIKYSEFSFKLHYHSWGWGNSGAYRLEVFDCFPRPLLSWLSQYLLSSYCNCTIVLMDVWFMLYNKKKILKVLGKFCNYLIYVHLFTAFTDNHETDRTTDPASRKMKQRWVHPEIVQYKCILTWKRRVSWKK